MAIVLNSYQQDIFKKIKSAFSDFLFFDQLVADKLKLAIIDSHKIELNKKTTKIVTGRYFDVKSKTEDIQKEWGKIQLIFKACYVLILSLQEESRSLFWDSTDILLEQYPDFSIVDEEELQLLLNFRNMVKVTFMLVPPEHNKQTILQIAGRLEGSENVYITGGGQKPAVTRRVLIYEKEGKISGRKNTDTAQPSTGKRAAATSSQSNAKHLRLSIDEVGAREEPSQSYAYSSPNSDPSSPDQLSRSSHAIASAALPLINLPTETSDDALSRYLPTETRGGNLNSGNAQEYHQSATMTAANAVSALPDIETVLPLSNFPTGTSSYPIISSFGSDFSMEFTSPQPEELVQPEDPTLPQMPAETSGDDPISTDTSRDFCRGESIVDHPQESVGRMNKANVPESFNGDYNNSLNQPPLSSFEMLCNTVLLSSTFLPSIER